MKTKNSARKILSPSKLYLSIILVFLVCFGVLEIILFRQPSGAKETVADDLPKPVITRVPTVTPTLTVQQQTEIRRRKLTDFNQKYGPCRYVPILMYHHVLPNDEAQKILATKLNVPPEIFNQQIDYLISKGYQIIGLDEMLGETASNSLPGKPVVLTFDDGYRDFYSNVLPVLKGKNIKATLFVISQFVGGEKYVDWQQIKQMSDSGLVLIGDHTLNHPNLPSQDEEEEKNQIVSAKNIIEANTGRPVNFFAYPYGSANNNAKQVLAENGFLGAVVTTNAAPQCLGLPFEFSRIRIGAAALWQYGL